MRGVMLIVALFGLISDAGAAEKIRVFQALTVDSLSHKQQLHWLVLPSADSSGLDVRCAIGSASDRQLITAWRGGISPTNRAIMGRAEVPPVVDAPGKQPHATVVTCSARPNRLVLKDEKESSILDFAIVQSPDATTATKVRISLRVAAFDKIRAEETFPASCAVFSEGNFAEVVEFEAVSGADGITRSVELTLQKRYRGVSGVICGHRTRMP